MNPEKDRPKLIQTLKILLIRYPRWLFLSISLLVLFFLLTMPDQAGGKMSVPKPTLPKTIGLWTKPDSPQLVTEKNIFDYMNGAGELYIGYRFNLLEAYEYTAPNQQNILIELYFMKTSDDAFGLLSLDWSGEPMKLGKSPAEKSAPPPLTWPRALYGEGLLRLWSDKIYARIMAYQDTQESRDAVLSLGNLVIRERENPPGPELAQSLPDSLLPDWKLRRDRASFFRSHLVLNSLYYLGQENMLNLGLSTEAVTAPYERKKSSVERKRIQLLRVKYPSTECAQDALAHFHRVYLPETSFQVKPGDSGQIMDTFSIEDGWLGFKLKNNTLTFIFECPDRKSARTIIQNI